MSDTPTIRVKRSDLTKIWEITGWHADTGWATQLTMALPLGPVAYVRWDRSESGWRWDISGLSSHPSIGVIFDTAPEAMRSCERIVLTMLRESRVAIEGDFVPEVSP